MENSLARENPSTAPTVQANPTSASSKQEQRLTEGEGDRAITQTEPVELDKATVNNPGETGFETLPPSSPPRAQTRPLVAESNYMKSIEEITLEVVESEKTIEVRDELNGDQHKRISLRKTSFKYPYLIVEESLTVNSNGEETLYHAEALVADHLIVNLQPHVDLKMAKDELNDLNCSLGEKISEGIYLVKIKGTPSIDNHFEKRELLTKIEHLIEIVEPDYFVTIVKTPNDSHLNRLWGLHNTGQTGGTQDKDVDGPEAWDKTTGSKNVLGAVIDTGIDRNHEDLKANMWTNPGEIAGNGKDDDGNGYIDDVHGWDFVNNDNNPHDDHSHGTHCAGTIGGVGNNGKGVVGVAWNISMVGIKFLSRSGSGSSSDAIKSIAYATKIGVDFTSNSWGGGGSSSSLKRVIEEAGKKGIGFIAAAGNHNGNNDSRPSYPASYDLDNIIAVGANDHNGKKADFSCYGKNSVDLFAPGVNIYSTVPGNKYASYQGTSMATPQVAGAYALVQSLNLDWTCKQIKEALMSSTDTESSLKDRCVTGGRLNAFKALQAEPAKERLIAAKPTKVDFGKVAANQNKTLEFTLGNSGTSDTTISKVFIAGGNFRSKDLIASWPLNGNAKDSSGNGHDGKVVNATLTSDRFGRSNQAYSFDGTGDYIEIPHNQSFNCLPITISVWFKSESVKAGGVVGKYVSGAWNGWLVHQYNDAIVPWYLRSTTRRVIGKYGEDPFESKITRSKWNHVVSVFNEKEGRLYLNGVHKDTHPWTGTPGTPTSSYTINIGRCPSSGSTQYDFTGSIDDVRIYETAMGADEVIELYEENTAGKFFTVDLKTPIVIKPKNFQTGKVTFQSSEQGLKQAEMIVLSDAKNAPRLVIPLSAEITTTPDLVVNPESMHFDLNENETKTQALTLSNKGDGELTYQVSVLGASGNPSKKTEVFGMGYNFHGQLGDGTRTNRYKPVQSILAATESIAAGGYHNLFLKKDDSLWATGYNYWGELGDGTRSTRYKPVQILSGGVQAIAGGGYHTLILKNDGSLWATGYNHYGQLGDGTTTMRLKPVQILSGGVQAIAAGYYHSLFIKKDGSLWTMGRNSWGALGDGSSTHRSKPVQILSGGVRNVDGGAFHSLFVKNDDSLWAMGRNYYGELGDGTRSTRTKPVLIMSGGVETVASRLGYHSLVLKKDHSLWAMGRNNYGQLGDGSTSDRTKPVRVIAGDVQKIAAGYNHSLVLKKDGSLWAMGYNYYGQLGDGTRTQRLKPVRVMAGGVGEISGGGQHSLFLKGEGNGEAPQWLTIGDSQGEKGLVASYPFDGDAKDVSGNQNHATLNGPTFRPDRNQKTNGALYFDGVNDRVVIPTNKNISTNFSVQFWAKPERTNYIGSESDSGMPGLGQRVAVLNAHHGGRDSKIAGLGITLGANGYATYQHAHYLYSTTLAYPANLANWNHFTTICRDNRVELYLNRKLVKTGIKLNRPNFLSSVASLGTCPSWGPHYKGYLDEFKVYDRALTADDVRSQKSKGNNNGSLPAGKSIAINVSANASKMPTEYEEAHILISSNDPDEPQKKIKVTAQKLSENAGLVFRPSSLSFENTYVGQTAEKALILSNAGTKELTVNQFVFRDSTFSHRLYVPFTLKPGEKRDATIYFTPQSAGKVVSSALVLTNEDGGKTRTFQISGEGSLAPVMVITPPSLSATLKSKQEKTVNLRISNSGGSSLNWTLKGATTGGGKFLSAPFFAQSHFMPMEKGSPDNRKGMPISTLGGGPDLHGYNWTDSNDAAGPAHQWKDISKTGKLLSEASKADDAFDKVALPFSIELYGKKFNEVFVSSNGYLSFGKGSSEHGHFPLPTTMMPGNLVAPFAMDLDPSRGGEVYVQQTTNEFLVQWNRVKDFAGIGEYTFQASLNRNGVIYFHYEKMDGKIERATTGIQNESADQALLVAYNNQQVKADSTIRISTSPKWLHIATTSGTIGGGKYVNVPVTFKSGSILAGNYKAILGISGNDPKRPTAEVPVSLTIQATRTLAVNPTTLDFGQVSVGATGEKTVQVTNTGNAAISIGQINTGNAVFTSSTGTKSLKPGEASSLLFRFNPVNGTSYASTCRVYSNAENSPTSIRLNGKGIASPRFSFDPESVAITLPAGQKATSLTSLLNKGQATGNFSLKEIRNDTKSKGFMKIPDVQPMETDPFAAKHIPNRLIIRYKDGQSGLANPGALGAQVRTVRELAKAQKSGTGVKALSGLNLSLVETIQNANLRDVAKALSQDPAVEYVEPDYVRGVSLVPNDPDWASQYALQKIQAPQAWEKTKGSHSVIVAVIDTGIDYNHKDLQGNIWKNPGEIAGNRKDDDGNGYIDDVYGWDFRNNDNDPMDGNRHGTHVAGTIAAASNNGLQVAGVAWKTKLVALKFLSDQGWGSVSDAIDAVAYCTAMNFPISNNSWGGGGSSKAMKDAIDRAGKNGHLFCAAAGNSGTNNDSRPHYPSSYTSPNVLSVAASDSADRLASFTCYGKTSVDLAAPGVSILNLVPNNGIAKLSGTSMATPHVAGAAALVLSLNADARFAELKQTIMDSVDPIKSYEGKMVAPGRLNLLKALEGYSPEWLSVSPEKGSVSAGKSSNLTFSIDATELTAGTKRAVVCFETNDPLAKVLEIAVELTVTGEPEIETDKKSLDFGELWVGKKKELKLSISNPGTDELKVSRLALGHKDLTVSPSTLSVEPGGKEVVTILANPKSSGTVSTNLTIVSNAKNAAQLRIQVSLKAILPPALRFAPDNLLVTLEPDQSGKETLEVSNNGDADGTWKGSLVEISKNRSRTRNVTEVIKVLNLRKPDFMNPGTPMIEDLSGNSENNPTIAIRTGVNDAKSDLEIAILGADHSTYLADVAKGLAETKRFAGVTTINVRSVTPTASELKNFDSLIVYNNFSYRDSKSLGDNMVEYADNGGGIVCMTFETSTLLGSSTPLRGRWLEKKYGVFSHTSKDSRNWSEIGEITTPNHPLLKEVKSFQGSYRLNTPELVKGSSIAAKWKDGLPLVAYREDIANVVGLNFFPVSNRMRLSSKGWDIKTDGWKLMANALEWSAQGGSPDWLKVDPLSGVVRGRNKETVSVAFNSANLNEGNYSAELRVSSNDPVKPYQVVKIKLVVRKNAPPVAKPSVFTLLEDGTKAFRLEAHDPEGAPISFSLISQPRNGKLSGTAPSLTYHPNANFNGTDEFSFNVSDGKRESNVAKVQFRVSAVNDAPWAKSANLSSLEDELVSLDLQYGDPDGDKLRLDFTTKPQNGFVVQDNGSWVYFPNPHFNGKDLIKFRVHDGKTASNEATLVLDVKPTNDAPIASDSKVTAQEGKRVNFELVAADVDGDAMAYELVSSPKHGRIETSKDKRWAFTPNAGYNGKDFLTFRASDGKVRGNLAQVNFEVTQRNDPPVVAPSTFALLEDGQLKVKLIASDPEGDRLTFKVTASSNNGSLTGNGPTYSYKPDTNFNGTDTFTVVASDGQSNSQPAVITLLVSSQNDAPSLPSEIGTLSASYRETIFRMRLEGEDPDGDELTYNLSQKPINGTCSIEGDQLIYMPDPGFTGTEKIEVQVSDGKLSDVATLMLPVEEHPNSVGLFIDLDSSEIASDFLYNLYEMNERLQKTGEYLLKLDDGKMENNFAGSISNEVPAIDAITLAQWKDQIQSFDPKTAFTFHPQAKGGEIAWQVTSFLENTPGTDTDLVDNDKDEQKDPGESPDSPDPSSAPTAPPVVRISDLPRVVSNENAPNWFSLSGLGNFFNAGNDWIYQPEMGWCFAKVNQSDLSVWVYNEQFGWMWFPTGLPNVTYMVGEFANGWTYFPKSSVTEAGILYDYTNESWIKLK